MRAAYRFCERPRIGKPGDVGHEDEKHVGGLHGEVPHLVPQAAGIDEAEARGVIHGDGRMKTAGIIGWWLAEKGDVPRFGDI